MSADLLVRFEHDTLVADEAEARRIDEFYDKLPAGQPGRLDTAISQVHEKLAPDLPYTQDFGYQIVHDALRWNAFRHAYLTTYVDHYKLAASHALNAAQGQTDTWTADRSIQQGEPFYFHTFARAEAIRRGRVTANSSIGYFAFDRPLKLELDLKNSALMNAFDATLALPGTIHNGDESISGIITETGLPAYEYTLERQRRASSQTVYRLAVFLSRQAAGINEAVTAGDIDPSQAIVRYMINETAHSIPTVLLGESGLFVDEAATKWMAKLVAPSGPYIFDRAGSPIPELAAGAQARPPLRP